MTHTLEQLLCFVRENDWIYEGRKLGMEMETGKTMLVTWESFTLQVEKRTTKEFAKGISSFEYSESDSSENQSPEI